MIKPSYAFLFFMNLLVRIQLLKEIFESFFRYCKGLNWSWLAIFLSVVPFSKTVLFYRAPRKKSDVVALIRPRRSKPAICVSIRKPKHLFLVNYSKKMSLNCCENFLQDSKKVFNGLPLLKFWALS